MVRINRPSFEPHPLPLGGLLRNWPDHDPLTWLGGPIVYCAEERDNGANLHLLHLDGNALSGDASRVKVEPFTFQAGAYLDDPQAEGYPDSLFCLVQPWRKRDEDFPGRGLKATITQARCGF